MAAVTHRSSTLLSCNTTRWQTSTYVDKRVMLHAPVRACGVDVVFVRQGDTELFRNLPPHLRQHCPVQRAPPNSKRGGYNEIRELYAR